MAGLLGSSGGNSGMNIIRYHHDSESYSPQMGAVEDDMIIVNDLVVRTFSGVERWERVKKQNMIINLWLHCSTKLSCEEDSLKNSFNYGTISKLVCAYCEESSFKSIEALALSIARLITVERKVPKVTVRVSKPTGLIQAKCASIEITRRVEDFTDTTEEHVMSGILDKMTDKIIIQDLHVYAIIGLNPWERENKQNLYINAIMWADCEQVNRAAKHDGPSVDYRKVSNAVMKFIEASSYKTLESLVGCVAKLIVCECNVPRVTLRIDKPNALLFAQSSAIQITRTRDDFK
eukprot:Nk52_evm10s260 gene=Nk52_evmTU10s260